MPIKQFSQKDTQWKSKRLGYGTGTIGSYGCTLTCLAMMADIAPDKLNIMLKGTSLQDSAFAGGSKNLIWWTQLDKHSGGLIKFHWRGSTYNNDKVKEAVATYGSCLVEVDFDGSPKTDDRHWVLFIGDGQAIDPWTGKIIPTSNYKISKGYAVIEISKEAGDEKTIPVKISDFEGLRTKADALDKFNDAGFKTVNDVLLTIETNEERIKTLKDDHRSFLLDMINILDPNSVLPELPDDDWVKTLAKQVVDQFSTMQSAIKSQKIEYEKSAKAIVAENVSLAKEVQILSDELSSLREQYQKNTKELNEQHSLEIEELKVQQVSDFDRLEKRINTVSTNIDVNKERREENKRVGNFIIELFNKLFNKKDKLS